MREECPKCRRPIAWSKLRSQFACPHCEAPLTARTTGPLIAAIILWTIVEIPIKFIVYQILGDGDASFVVWAIASGVVGWCILSLVVGGFSTVEQRGAQSDGGAV